MEIYEMSYNDIISLNNPIYLNEFKKILETINENIYSPYKSLYQMIEETKEIKDMNISTYFFNNQYANFYNIIEYRKSSKERICCFSGNIINKYDEYIYYKVLIYLPQKKEAFILRKPICTLSYYIDELPSNLKEFEEFAYLVRNAYSLNLDKYYNFYTNYKDDIILRKLSNKKQN